MQSSAYSQAQCVQHLGFMVKFVVAKTCTEGDSISGISSLKPDTAAAATPSNTATYGVLLH